MVDECIQSENFNIMKREFRLAKILGEEGIKAEANQNQAVEKHRVPPMTTEAPLTR